ncbi:MAG: hypothetical protein JO322_05220, partial [Candidatus Eremiobacteraeota bacterium]|nr:hypothetical protein [Candidatus Eremiobacteraeota bacterium]
MKKLAVILLVAGVTSCSGGGNATNSSQYEPSLKTANGGPFTRSCQLVPSTLSGTNSYNQNYANGASANDAWTTAGNGISGRVPDLYHFDGTAWNAVVVPPLNGSSNWNFAQLGPIAAVSPNDVWIAGAGFNHTGSAAVQTFQRRARQGSVIPFSPPPSYAFPFMLHWDGTSLSVVIQPPATSTGVQLLNMSAISSTDIWATGIHSIESLPRKYFTVVQHWNGTQWTTVPPPETAQSQP